MKSFIAAALLLSALASPAHAKYDRFDCSNGIAVSVGEVMNVGVNDPKNPHEEGTTQYPYPVKGKFTLEWDHRRNIMRVNGKACTFITERMDVYRECVDGGIVKICDELKRWEPNLTEAERRAIKKAKN